MPTQITATQVIALILALAACRYASGVLAPLLFAVMAALALAPLVKALARVIPRWIAAAIVVIGDRRRIRTHGVAAVGRSRELQPPAARASSATSAPRCSRPRRARA